jgi:uncharacterized membrane protein YraQ (UPF0718 family)
MNFITTLWNYLNLTAPYLLLGMVLSGIIHVLVPAEWILKHLGKKNIFSIFKASAVGVPLPLCSCSVIPTAVTLSKMGATNAATSAFLISTPETGVDSILITYGMMDLPMTIIRPVAAFITATLAGLLNYFFNTTTFKKVSSDKEECCGCEHDHEHDHDHHKADTIFKQFFNFIYHDLVDDLAKWVILGLFLGAAIDYFVPVNILGQLNGFSGKLIMIAIGIPLYICASSTTPIAASLIMKGMSPGTALILLLTGPATNISTLVVMQNYIGKKGVILNAIAIAVTALGISFLVDFLYQFYAWPINFKVSEIHEHGYFGNWNYLLSVTLILLLAKGLYANFQARKHS